MSGTDPKADLRHYLQRGRGALLWKLDGLSEYDARRPLVPTGTNLLGLVKHVASVDNLPGRDAGWWEGYRDRLERVAREAGPYDASR